MNTALSMLNLFRGFSMHGIFARVSRALSGLGVGVAIVCMVLGSTALAQESTEGGEEEKTRQVSGISEKTYRKFAEAQELMEADDFQGAVKVLRDVENKKNLSSAEAIQLYNFFGVLYFNQEKYKEAIGAFEKMLAEPEIEERQRVETLYTMAQLYFTIEDWPGAISIMEQWLAAVPNPPPEPLILLASAYYQVERYSDMIEPIERAMSIARERDKPVKEQWWLLLRVAYYELYDQTKEKQYLVKVKDILEILVVTWPKKEYWTMLSGLYGELDKESRQLGAYESAYDQGFLVNSSELTTFAQLLMQAEVAYKSARVLEKGFEAGIVEKTESNYRLLSQAWQLAAEYEKAISPLKQAASISGDGELDVRLANSYLNLSRYDECIAAARSGLKKGGLKRPGSAQELLGMCLFEKDEYEASKAAFRKAAKDKKIEKRALNWVKYIGTEQARIDQLNASIKQQREALADTDS
jgi:tetratricopeptide (TPR) repeat protein